jgi:hypothetical protein
MTIIYLQSSEKEISSKLRLNSRKSINNYLQFHNKSTQILDGVLTTTSVLNYNSFRFFRCTIFIMYIDIINWIHTIERSKVRYTIDSTCH